MKHIFKLDTNFNIDDFAYVAGEYHNGPRCIICGKGDCEHCHPEIYTEECKETKEVFERALKAQYVQKQIIEKYIEQIKKQLGEK